MKKTEIIEKFSKIVGSENVVKNPANFYARCTVKNIDEYNSIIEICKEHYKDKTDDGYFLGYRGQCYDCWRIYPSISRTTGLNKYEKDFLDYFSKQMNDIGIETTFINKMFFAQHYGLPTRLLDVTTEPNVALWFATSSFIKNNHTEHNGEVIVMPVRYVDDSDVLIKYNEWQIENFKNCVGKSEEEVIKIFCAANGIEIFEKNQDIIAVNHSFPKNKITKRVFNQNAVGVIMPLRFYKSEHKNITRTGSFYLSIYRKNLISIKIDGSFKEHIRDELDKIDINECSVYGNDLEHSSKYKISQVKSEIKKRDLK